MDFGMPTLIGCASPQESAALCRRLGLSFIELNMNLPEYQPDRLEEVLKNRPDDIYYTLHLDENLNPFDFNAAVADAWRDTALKTASLARKYGVPVLNMHIPRGAYFTLPGRKAYLYDEYWPEVERKISGFRDALAEAAGDVHICLENTIFSGFAHLPDTLELLLEAPCFGLTYDCGHDHTDICRALPFYQRHANRLLHFHMHDYNGRTAHLPLGDGEMDIDRMLCMAAGCRVVLEVKDVPGLFASVERIAERNLL